jgi:hypothetical protein
MHICVGRTHAYAPVTQDPLPFAMVAQSIQSSLSTWFMQPTSAGRARCFRLEVLTRSRKSIKSPLPVLQSYVRLRPSVLALPLSYFVAFARRHFVSYKFSLPRIPGGSLMPIPPPFSPPLPTLTLLVTCPGPFSPLFVISSTRSFLRLNAGHTHTPQLHGMPCHA